VTDIITNGRTVEGKLRVRRSHDKVVVVFDMGDNSIDVALPPEEARNFALGIASAAKDAMTAASVAGPILTKPTG